VIIHDVQVSDFRNLASIALSLSPRFNIFHGENAQGKTNFLEALAVLTELRSFRSATLEQMVGLGSEQSTMGLTANSAGLDYEIRLELSKGKRRLRVNDKAVTRHKDYLGRLPSVVFAPEDVNLSKGGPDRRRRFLDRALYLVQSSHWTRMTEYKQVLKRRNALLKEQRTMDPLFEVYTEKLATLGAEISFNRHMLTQSLQGLVAQAVKDVSGSEDKVHISYATHLPDTDGEVVSDNGASLMDLMKGRLPRDRKVGYTSVGPHVADLVVEIGGMPASSFASQGQHRTIALALKVAEIEVIHRMRGAFPILLIDDLSSELDAGRRERLFDYLKRTGGQVVLTSTDPDIAAGFTSEDLAVFHVENGEIRVQE